MTVSGLRDAPQEKQQQMYRRTPFLFRMADSFFRHQLLFWSALLIVSGLTMTALYVRSKTFHATALTQVQPETLTGIVGPGDTNTWTPPAQKNADSFMELVKQDQPGGFLDAALQRAHLTTPINVDPRADDPRYALLQKNLNANVESANQFSINLTWDNEDETRNIVDALQKQYIDEVGVDRSAKSIGSVRFLDSQIGSVENRMRRAEQALTDFKMSNGGQLSDAQSTYNNQLSSLKAELDEKQITVGESGRKKAILEQELAQMKPMGIIEQTVSDQSPMEKEIAALMAQRETVMSSRGGLTPDHPDVVAIDDQIKRLQNKERAQANAPENKHNTQTKTAENPQYQLLKQQIADASIAQDADQQEMQNLRQQIGKYALLVNKIPIAQRQLADKTRDYGEAQELDQSLRKLRDQVQLTANLDRLTARSSLMPIGVIYALPTTGKTKQIAMLIGSLLLGCLVGAILVVLSEWSDHSLRHEADAERLLGVPVLAALPETADLRTAPTRHALSGGAPALTGPTSEG